MSGFNKKGPEGQGPGTGRSLGKCNPENKKTNEQFLDEDNSAGRGRGQGRGLRGFGVGRGRGIGRRQGRRSET